MPFTLNLLNLKNECIKTLLYKGSLLHEGLLLHKSKNYSKKSWNNKYKKKTDKLMKKQKKQSYQLRVR